MILRPGGWASGRRRVDGESGGETIAAPVTGRVQASDGEALRHLALRGVGLARLTTFTARDDIAAQAAAAWEAAICWNDDYSIQRLAEVPPA